MIIINEQQYIRLRQVALILPRAEADLKNNEVAAFYISPMIKTEIYRRESEVFYKLKDLYAEFNKLLRERDVDTYKERELVGTIKQYIFSDPQCELCNFINTNFHDIEEAKKFLYRFQDIKDFNDLAHLAEANPYLRYICDCVISVSGMVRKDYLVLYSMENFISFLRKSGTNYQSWTAEEMDIFCQNYGELYHDAYMMLGLFSNLTISEAVEKEKKRREAISQSKKDEARQTEIAKICSEIRDNSVKKKSSISNECNKYFKYNKVFLEKLEIRSARTLKNHCSTYNPNRARTKKNEISLREPLSAEFCDIILN